jgi:hypothetical protein
MCSQHHAHHVDSRWMVCVLPVPFLVSQALNKNKICLVGVAITSGLGQVEQQSVHTPLSLPFTYDGVEWGTPYI